MVKETLLFILMGCEQGTEWISKPLELNLTIRIDVMHWAKPQGEFWCYLKKFHCFLLCRYMAFFFSSFFYFCILLFSENWESIYQKNMFCRKWTSRLQEVSITSSIVMVKFSCNIFETKYLLTAAHIKTESNLKHF